MKFEAILFEPGRTVGSATPPESKEPVSARLAANRRSLQHEPEFSFASPPVQACFRTLAAAWACRRRDLLASHWRSQRWR